MITREAYEKKLAETNEQNKTAARTAIFDQLEGWVRERIQLFIQEVLEQEVTDFLGRSKSERRAPVDAAEGYRNGYGKERRLALTCGTITVRRPRVRDVEEKFESRLLPLFARRSKEVGEMLPELYLHGLASGDFELALRGLLGDGAPLSASSIGRLKVKWQGEYEEWKQRSLAEMEVVYLWVDGIYVKAGLEKDKACLLVALAGLSDGRKVFLGIESGQRESTESWGRLLRGLRERGLKKPRVVIGDGHLGIWAALRNVWPEVDEQRCWNHRIMNVLDRLPKRLQGEATALLKKIPVAGSLKEAERLKGVFQAWCRSHGFADVGLLLDVDWERMVTFYRYPREHWKHLRTSNPVESPFVRVRLRTDASRRFKKVENGTALVWKTLMIAEKKMRRLDAPELMKEVSAGALYE
ncbi:MAG: IS256 family transposase, partial [Acidobacteria bacterium]|nr:IS256 family transposase [Acidobacteriota bacterium]